MIILLLLFPDQRSGFSSSRKTACDSLVNVNVLNGILVLEMFNMQSDGAVFDRDSRKPADTLQSQDIVGTRVRK